MAECHSVDKATVEVELVKDDEVEIYYGIASYVRRVGDPHSLMPEYNGAPFCRMHRPNSLASLASVLSDLDMAQLLSNRIMWVRALRNGDATASELCMSGIVISVARKSRAACKHHAALVVGHLVSTTTPFDAFFPQTVTHVTEENLNEYFRCAHRRAVSCASTSCHGTLDPLHAGTCSCALVTYCSKACQRADWGAGHKAIHRAREAFRATWPPSLRSSSLQALHWMAKQWAVEDHDT